MFFDYCFVLSFIIFTCLLLIVFMFFSCFLVIFLEISFRSNYPPFRALIRQLDAEEISHVNSLGLSHLCWILALVVNHDLLIVLIECFHSEMKTFHFPLGEMTITQRTSTIFYEYPSKGHKWCMIHNHE